MLTRAKGREYRAEPTPENRAALRDFPTPASVKWQYLQGVPAPSLVSPNGYTLEGFQVSRPGNEDIQLDLLLDYASNVENYPHFQAYFRAYQPPLLAVWGKNDPYFRPARAPGNVTCPTQISVSMIPGTSRWKRTRQRSSRLSWRFSTPTCTTAKNGARR